VCAFAEGTMFGSEMCDSETLLFSEVDDELPGMGMAAAVAESEEGVPFDVDESAPVGEDTARGGRFSVGLWRGDCCGGGAPG